MASRFQDEFQALIEGHKGILYKICRAYCRSEADREDLAQEILVQLWHAFPSFDGRARFSTWMYRVALNVAISFLRRETTRTRHVLSSEEHLLEATAPVPAGNAETKLLYDYIAQLDPLHKALLLLYLDDNSYAEMAAILGISETNVATRISRLKQKMKRDISTAAGGNRMTEEKR